MTSPVQNSLKLLKTYAALTDVVERWIPQAKVRRDLFGIIDIVSLCGTRTCGIQATTYSNVAARVKKIRRSPAYPELCQAGWVLEVHGWRKVKNRWTVRIVKV